MKFHDSGTSHHRTFFLVNRLAETTLNALKTYKLKAEKVTGKEMVYVHTVRGTLKFQYSDSVTHVTLCNSCDSV